MNTQQHHINNVLIAEDHDIYGDGLALIVKHVLPNACINVVRDYPSAINLLNQAQHIQLAFFDIKMPGAVGLEGIINIKKTFPTMIIIVVSSLDFDTNIQKIIDIGVNGFISKSTSRELLISAINRVLEGHIVVEAERPDEREFTLSNRQLQTLSYMALGKTNKEIAKALEISPNTAKEYVSKVIRVLGVENRTQAVQVAEHSGLLLRIQ